MPRIPGELVAKRTSQKKKGSDPKNTNLQFTPPIATNMEVNLRIVTLVNVEFKKKCSTVNGGGVKDRALANMALPTSYFK